MAYCTPQTLSDIAVECGSNVGGVEVVAVRNRADVEAVTLTSGVVTGVTLGSSAPAAATVIAFRPQTCSFSSEATIDDVAGVHYYTNTLAFRFAKMSAAKRTSVSALTHAETIAVVKDNNGTYWLVGVENALHASANSGNTGTAYSDANEYTPSLACVSPDLPMTIDSTALATFLGTAVI